MTPIVQPILRKSSTTGVDLRPDCEGELVTDEAKRYHARRGWEQCCGSKAVYIIDSKKLCRRHASALALRLLVSGQLVWR